MLCLCVLMSVEDGGGKGRERECDERCLISAGSTALCWAASLSVSHFAVQRPCARPTITWNRTPVLRELIEFLGASPTIFHTPSTRDSFASTSLYALSRMSSLCEFCALC